MTRSIRRANAGFNLIEAAVVLGIAGLVVAAVFAAYASVAGANRVKQGSEELSIILSNIRNAYAAQGSMETSSTSAATFTQALVNGNIAPSRWFNTGRTGLITPWSTSNTNSDFTVAPNTTTMTFSVGPIRDTGECARFVATVYNNTITSGLTTIGATAVTTATGPAAAGRAGCPAATNNTPTFIFNLK